MKRIYPSLRRFLRSFTPECLAAIGSAFFGLHMWLARSWFNTNSHSAFQTIIPPGTQHGQTVLLIILPLLCGSFLQTCGIWRHSRLPLMLGTLLEFFVFCTALISCCIGNPWGTGLPAYTFLTAFSLLLFLYRCLGIEWISLP